MDSFQIQAVKSPLGSVLLLANQDALYRLEFVDRADRLNIVEYGKSLYSPLYPGLDKGTNPIIEQIQEELEYYFKGKLQEFNTPIFLEGTPFQKKVWVVLQSIPYARTISYQEEAQALGNAQAQRAVGQANGKNLLSILVPCHRVINSNGKLGGYSAGLERKKWLLDHETQHI